MKMLKRTLKAIFNRMTVNCYATFLLSLVFSVQLMLFAWIENVFGPENQYYFKTQLISFRVALICFLIVSVSSAITVANYVLIKRKAEFNCFFVCGANSFQIYVLKSLHILIITLISELVGTGLFGVIMSVLNLSYKLILLIYVYTLFLIIVLIEVTIKHILSNRRRING